MQLRLAGALPSVQTWCLGFTFFIRVRGTHLYIILRRHNFHNSPTALERLEKYRAEPQCLRERGLPRRNRVVIRTGVTQGRVGGHYYGKTVTLARLNRWPRYQCQLEFHDEQPRLRPITR